MRALVAGLLIALAAGEAQAGAWPRPKGETFVSVTRQQTTGARTLIEGLNDLQSWSSLYAEHGLTSRFTLGLIAGTGSGPGRYDGATEALVFLRMPVWSPGQHRFAAEIGIGTLDAEWQGRERRLRPGLSWGRGFASRWGDGWMGIESSAEFRQPSGDTVLKADVTAGLKPNDDWMWIAQVQSGRFPGNAPIVRFAPSIVRRLGGRMHLQVGGVAPIAGDDAFGATVSLWLTF